MKALLTPTLVAVSLFACSGNSAAPRTDAQSRLGGTAPAGLVWQSEDVLKECLVPLTADTGLGVVRTLTDTLEAIALARAFLGTRVQPADSVRIEAASTEGFLLRFHASSSPHVVDGANRVYVDRYRCFTYLGA